MHDLGPSASASGLWWPGCGALRALRGPLRALRSGSTPMSALAGLGRHFSEDEM